jgi:hypothetical protein
MTPASHYPEDPEVREASQERPFEGTKTPPCKDGANDIVEDGQGSKALDKGWRGQHEFCVTFSTS